MKRCFSSINDLNSICVHFRSLKVGPPENDVFMGALVSKEHLEKVTRYILQSRHYCFTDLDLTS